MQSIVEAVIENSHFYPNKDAIIYDDSSITYSELEEKINMFSLSLKSKKISKGSRIMIEADDLISYFCAFLGCELYGCIAVPFEKNISIYKFQDLYKTINPKLVFMKNNGEDYNEFFQNTLNTGNRFSLPKYESICAITSTTGTTGKPSLVTHSNGNMVTTIENLYTAINIDSNSVLFTNMPFDLAAGYRRVFAVLYRGATAVITHKNFCDETLSYFNERYNLTHLSLISSDLSILCNTQTPEKLLKGIKYVESAAGALPSGIITKFYQNFPDVLFFSMYGSTESGCILVNNTRVNYSEDCIGKPTCNSQICLIDENGDKITESGKYGYVAVSGEMNMQGYFRKKALTEQVMYGNRLILNDIAYFDNQQYYYFVSRVGDIINVAGHKVNPAEIEKIAINFEGILDCACIAKADLKYGQIPILFVQYKKGCAADTTKLANYLEEKLENYRIPKKIIPIKKIPRTTTGKLMRKSLSMIEY